MKFLSLIGEWLRRGLYLALFSPFILLPIDAASALGSWLARTIGPRLGVQRIARRNMTRAFPEKTPAEIDAHLVDMWDNLGRVIGEFPHLDKIDLYHDPRIELVGLEHVDALLQDGRPGLFFSGHVGNWELSIHAVAKRAPLTAPMAAAYRAPNDDAADWLIRRLRRSSGAELLPKGAKGSRRIVDILRAGGHVGILPDQKQNDGIAAPFFGRPAMTTSAIARLAIKFDCVVMPGRVERIDGLRFRLTAYPPLPVPNTGDLHADVLALTTTINQTIEGWIRERPGHWFWVHRRWPD